jgi:protein kinase A
MYKKIVSGERLNFPRNVNQAAQDLITKLLVNDPERRIKEDDIFDHLFFAGLDWQKVLSLQYAAPYIPRLVTNM